MVLPAEDGVVVGGALLSPPDGCTGESEVAVEWVLMSMLLTDFLSFCGGARGSVVKCWIGV
jgi:hypothetical protein